MMLETTSERAASETTRSEARWYEGISRYAWIVLILASMGWVFDAFEGQIFVASMNEAMPSLVPAATSAGRIALYNNVALGAFLLGGALGGVIFGVLSDRIGRKQTLSITILFYSVFTCLSAFSQEWWQLSATRFLVALGVGGEWAVASALVAEVFPKRARAHAGGIFHATSVLGTYLAIAAGIFLIGNPGLRRWAQGLGDGWLGGYVDPATIPWRLGFAVGLVPALLIIWIRRHVREPESWEAARARARNDPSLRMGRWTDLFRGELMPRTLVGVTLAAVGLATFWGAHIYGKDMLRAAAERQYLSAAAIQGTGEPGDALAGALQSDGTAAQQRGEALTAAERAAVLEPHTTSLKRWEMLGMFLVTTGGGLGLLCFGPISQRLGRRRAFLYFQLGGLAIALLVFLAIKSVGALLIALPVFGFLTLGMHAGYAIYFPELYPTRLRGSGTGFCFNAGRLVAAPVLFAGGWLRAGLGLSLPEMASILSALFLIGALVLAFAPETQGQDLLE